MGVWASMDVARSHSCLAAPGERNEIGCGQLSQILNLEMIRRDVIVWLHTSVAITLKIQYHGADFTILQHSGSCVMKHQIENGIKETDESHPVRPPTQKLRRLQDKAFYQVDNIRHVLSWGKCGAESWT